FWRLCSVRSWLHRVALLACAIARSPWMADFRPELPNYVRPRIRSERDSTCGKSARKCMQAGGLPEPRDKTAGNRAGNAAGGHCRLTRRLLFGNNGTHQRVTHSRTEARLFGSGIGKILLQQSRDTQLDRAADRVLP